MCKLYAFIQILLSRRLSRGVLESIAVILLAIVEAILVRLRWRLAKDVRMVKQQFLRRLEAGTVVMEKMANREGSSRSGWPRVNDGNGS